MMKKPNVLMICVDDMNDWVGCLDGYPGVSTPSLDNLAQNGTLFTNAHCPSSLCNPSRSAIFTGLRPENSGIYDNRHWWRPSLPDVITLPKHFKNNGYHVAGAGKIFHHTDGFNPPDQWDEYFDLIFDDPWDRKAYQRVIDEPCPAWHPLNQLEPYKHEFDWGVLEKGEEEYGDAMSAQWAVDFLGKSHDKPFFLAVGMFHPHLPCYAPREYFDRYPLDRIVLPEIADNDIEFLPETAQQFIEAGRPSFRTILEQEQWENAVQAYLASISFADAQIGKVLAALEENGLADNTIIVFFSDNGFHLGERDRWHKGTLWERATHVPFIFATPAHGPKGQTCARPVNLQDIYPTLLELCDLPSPVDQNMDGQSIAPLLADPDKPWSPVTICTYLPGNYAVRSERYRYIRYGSGGEELYDHLNDPLEHHNLSNDAGYTDTLRELAEFCPQTSVAEAPTKDYWLFDYDSYKWTQNPDFKQ